MCEEHERMIKRRDEVLAELRRPRDPAKMSVEEKVREIKRYIEVDIALQRLNKLRQELDKEWNRPGRIPTQEDVARACNTALAILDGIQT